MRAPRKLQERDAGARIERSEDTVRFVKAARLRIIKAAMMLITKRTVSSDRSILPSRKETRQLK